MTLAIALWSRLSCVAWCKSCFTGNAIVETGESLARHYRRGKKDPYRELEIKESIAEAVVEQEFTGGRLETGASH